MMNWLDLWMDSIAASFGNMDLATIEPFNFDNMHPLYSREWANRFLLAISRRKQLDISFARLAKRITGPSHFRAQYYFMLADLKFARITREKRLEIAKFFDSIISEKSKGDIYGFRSNIAHTGKEIIELCRKISFEKANPEIARFLGKLHTAAFHFVNGLYTDLYTDYGIENFGEYDVSSIFGPGHIMVIKSFSDLKPMDLWPEIRDSPCKTLNIYAVYKNVKFRCDSISCHSVYEGDPINGMAYYAVGVDGILINSMEKLEKIREAIEGCSIEQWKRLISQEKEQLKIKALMQRCYVLKNMFELLGIEWKPSADMINAVKDKLLISPFKAIPKDEKERRQFWKRFFDPRLEIYPS
ncbi:hypothetical protein HYU07_07620 [Candidatus Woesearchaeota archaeon]|nr:hypothetical protein [Candidatus Woesearchaeota archaeon]